MGLPPTPKSNAQNAYLFEFFLLHQLILLQLNIYFSVFFCQRGNPHVPLDGESWHNIPVSTRVLQEKTQAGEMKIIQKNEDISEAEEISFSMTSKI